MTEFLSLSDAIAAYVHDGSTVALEGFTRLIPFAVGHEIIRQEQCETTIAESTHLEPLESGSHAAGWRQDGCRIPEC